MDAELDRRQRSPSVARNRAAVLEVLRTRLSPVARVLEVGSGSGEHAAYFAEALPKITWIPSDVDADALASAAAWAENRGLDNVLAPLVLNVEDEGWPTFDREIDAVVSLNMIHIAPTSTTTGLLAGAARVLEPGGLLLLYGPFMRAGKHTAPSNQAFDRWLKDRDPRFGLRDLDEVEREAKHHGLDLSEVIEMPANNLSVVFEQRRRAD